jgi:hypothetical protein
MWSEVGDAARVQASVARGVAYAYNNTRADRTIAAIARCSETTPFPAATISSRPRIRPPNIRYTGTDTGYVRVGRRSEAVAD